MSDTESSPPDYSDAESKLRDAETPQTGDDTEVSFEGAIVITMAEHREGKLDTAREHYKQLLDFSPDEPILLHYSGVLEHQLGNSEEGLRRIRKASEALPDDVHVLLNLGNVLLQTDQMDNALVEYEKALSLDPDNVVAHCNKGALLRRLGEKQQAQVFLERAVQLNPEHGESWHNLGTLFRSTGEWDQATDCFEKALKFGGYLGSVSRATMQIVRIKQAMGQREEALQLLRDWAERDPENQLAKHLLAGATGEDIPERAADEVVVSTFQAFAADFDSILERLGYKAPELVGTRVQELCGTPEANLRVCDAGVGTGLVGEYLRPYAQQLVGVDLSVTMLAKARARNLYDELVEGELTGFLQSTDAPYDLITSVDTLCYIGELRGVVDAAATALNSGGKLVFTVEKALESHTAEKGYGLSHHGRYHHRADYIMQLLERDFTAVSIEEVELRQELGSQVAGLLVSAERQ